MNSIGGDGEGDVRAGVDQQARGAFAGGILANDIARERCYSLEIARGQVFFAELNVVDTVAGSLADFLDEAMAAGVFVAPKLPAIGNVIEQHGGVRRLRGWSWRFPG